MRIPSLILATLASFLVDCAPDYGQCDAGMEEVTVDVAITEGDVADMLWSFDLDSRDDISCQQACEHAYVLESGWLFDGEEDCEFTIDEEAGAESDAEVGHVRCEAQGREYDCLGRRPLGHVESEERGEGLAGYLARCVHLERASVVAFHELAGRLEEWGAPLMLVERCRLAAVEEEQHAVRLGALAEARGVEVAAPVQVGAVASRLAVALHNAVEGCVYEAWAAVCAAWSAERAEPELRAAYRQIAPDEAGHAQLAWDVHAWLMGQLAEDEVEVVLAAQRAALAGLPEVAAAQANPRALGLPGPAVCRAMARGFAAGLAA